MQTYAQKQGGEQFSDISVARGCLIYMRENSETQNSMKSSEKEREIGKE